MLIDIKAAIQSVIKFTMTGRFQRNPDGQFVGYIHTFFGPVDCWLVFDDDVPELANPTFLKLSLTTPYSGPTC